MPSKQSFVNILDVLFRQGCYTAEGEALYNWHGLTDPNILREGLTAEEELAVLSYIPAGKAVFTNEAEDTISVAQLQRFKDGLHISIWETSIYADSNPAIARDFFRLLDRIDMGKACPKEFIL